MSDQDVNININVDQEQASQGIGSMNSMFKGLGGNIALFSVGAVAALAGFAIAVGIKAVKAAGDLDSAVKDLGRATGASTEEMKDFKDGIKEIYKANLGESFEDIAGKMQEVKEQTGLTGQALTDFTKIAMRFSDVFDADVNESTRSAQMLMDQFGISSEEAFNLMTQGMQQGLNKNDDFLDSINEYSVHFKQMGFDSDEMFNILKNGAEEGAFSIDKVGDAMKEFGVRSKDGSDASKQAFKDLGFNADKMTERFAAGGEEAKTAMGEVSLALGKVDDKVLQNQIGVALFGTMFEDLGVDAISELTNIAGSFDKTKDSADQLNSTDYKSFWDAIQGIGRQIETGLLVPLGDMFLPILNKVSLFLAGELPQWIAKFSEVAEKVKDVFGSKIVKDLGGSMDKFQEFKTAVVDALSRTGERAAAFREPINKILGVLSTLVGYVNEYIVPVLTEAFTELVPVIEDFSNAMQEKFGQAVSIATKLFEKFKPYIAETFKAIGTIIKGAMEMIKGILKVATGIMKGDWKKVWSGIKDIIRGAVNIVKGIMQKMNATMASIANAIRRTVVRAFRSMVSGISSQLNNAKSKARSAIKGISTILTGIAKYAYNWGKNILSEFAKGMASKIYALKEKAYAAVNGIKKILGFYSPAEEGPGADADKWAPNFMKMYKAGFEIDSQFTGRLKNITGGIKTAAMAPIGLSSTSGSSSNNVFNNMNVYDNQTMDLLLQRFTKTVQRGGF